MFEGVDRPQILAEFLRGFRVDVNAKDVFWRVNGSDQPQQLLGVRVNEEKIAEFDFFRTFRMPPLTVAKRPPAVLKIPLQCLPQSF